MTNTKKVMEKQEKIKNVIRLESIGYGVKEITQFLKISKTTYYRYKQEIKIQYIDTIINKVRSEFKKHFDVFEAISCLNYSELSAIRSKYVLFGNSKKEKFESVRKFLEPYLYFEFTPKELLSKEQVKKQYFKMSKNYHPDSNKNVNSSVFVNFHRNYEYLQSICWI